MQNLSNLILNGLINILIIKISIDKDMIHIVEEFLENETVVIRLHGILDRSSLPDFKTILLRHLDNHRKVILDLDQIVDIDRDGRTFLRRFIDKIALVNIDEFLKLEFQDQDSVS